MKNDPVFNEKKKKNTVESETEPSIMNNMIEKVDQEILKKSSTNIFEACITEIKKSNKCNISIFIFLTLTFCFFFVVSFIINKSLYYFLLFYTLDILYFNLKRMVLFYLFIDQKFCQDSFTIAVVYLRLLSVYNCKLYSPYMVAMNNIFA